MTDEINNMLEEFWNNLADSWVSFWTAPSAQGGIALCVAALSFAGLIALIIYYIYRKLNYGKLLLKAEVQKLKAQIEQEKLEFETEKAKLKEELEQAKLTTSEKEKAEKAVKEAVAKKLAEAKASASAAKAKLNSKKNILDNLDSILK